MSRTVDGLKRAFDELYAQAQQEDRDDPNSDKLGGMGNRLYRDRVQILPDLYAAVMVYEEAKIRMDELLGEARSAGMSESLRVIIADCATQEAEM